MKFSILFLIIPLFFLSVFKSFATNERYDNFSSESLNYAFQNTNHNNYSDEDSGLDTDRFYNFGGISFISTSTDLASMAGFGSDISLKLSDNLLLRLAAKMEFFDLYIPDNSPYNYYYYSSYTYELNRASVGFDLGYIIELGDIDIVPYVGFKHTKINDFEYWYAKYNTTIFGLDANIQASENVGISFGLSKRVDKDAYALGYKLSSGSFMELSIDSYIKLEENLTFRLGFDFTDAGSSVYGSTQSFMLGLFGNF